MKKFENLFLVKLFVLGLIISFYLTHKTAFCEIREDGDCIISIGECLDENISKEEAIQRALNEARKEAIAYAVGITISSDVTLSQDEENLLFNKYTNINTSGHITEEEYTISEEDFGIGRHNLRIRKYLVTLRCKVEKEYGAPDPTFNVSFEMNKIIYKSNDIVELEVTASKDCYITILNFHELERKVYIIYPNEYDSDNFFTANTKRKIPSPNSGIVLRTILPERKTESRELIKVLAMKKKIDFSKGLPKESIYNYYPSPVAAGCDIGKILVNMPRDDWTQHTQILWVKE